MIHHLAVVHKDAQVGKNVTISPFAVIGEHVVLGDGCEIGPHVVIDGHTEIGEQCKFYPGASIGSAPQDLKYKGEETRLVIGSHNIFREYVTVNTGTVDGGGVTRFGSHSLMMAYAHVAHDCHVGDHAVLANCVALSGHVAIEDYAIVGGLSAIHQFARIGAHAILGGCSGVSQDVPPYMMASGTPARVYGLNSVGLKRHNFSEESMKSLQKAYRIFFRLKLNMKNALERVKSDIQGCPEVDYLVAFIMASERGVVRSVKGGE